MRPTRVLAGLLGVACAAATAKDASPINASTGGPLRPGVYGRIELRGTLPPLVNPRPVVAVRTIGQKLPEPVYLYVPSGQVRRWAQHCAKWNACERPVYFVRVDDSPSRLGAWSRTRSAPAAERAETLAWGRDPQP
jgi:hypothetical protein